MIYLDLQFLADPSPIPPPPDYFVEDLEDQDCPNDDDAELCGDPLDSVVDPHRYLVPLNRRLEAQGTLSDPGNESIRSLSIDQEDVTFEEQVGDERTGTCIFTFLFFEFFPGYHLYFKYS